MAVKQNNAHILKFVPDNYFFATSTFQKNSTSRALEEIQEFFKNLFQIKDILRVSFFMQGLFATVWTLWQKDKITLHVHGIYLII